MSYKDLLTYKQAEEIYDLTYEFCQKFLPGRDNFRLRDQMIHAARSGKQNIAEGATQGTSLKGYIKLLGVARGSLEELLEDYLDLSRHRKVIILLRGDQRVERVKIDLIKRTNYLLDKQIRSLEQKFVTEGGYTENLYKRRLEKKYH